MKTLTTSLQYFVVQKAGLSNKDAVAHILSGRVLVNGQKGQLTQKLLPADEVTLDGKVIKTTTEFLYLAYYKPRGVESTLNQGIENNLAEALHLPHRVFPVGRLDKESEGLLLLTNDGHFYNQINPAETHQEKEYRVTVDKPLTAEMLAAMAAGVIIMGKITRPAQVTQVDEVTFAIILTQGLNRQIRRMCYKLGYAVERLVRVRVVSVELGDLKPGTWRHLTSAEMEKLKTQLQLSPNS
ncbi:pseudouridine synthase [Rufibacter sp. LB8]|uniref:pseudouridine synthase n=1 Tax=Rufibacter sp. LB8 TaxID=2777781 RepID=UPI00178C1775|nr:pseudouridine synthase [Rufibacter sp. LB8]